MALVSSQSHPLTSTLASVSHTIPLHQNVSLYDTTSILPLLCHGPGHSPRRGIRENAAPLPTLEQMHPSSWYMDAVLPLGRFALRRRCCGSRGWTRPWLRCKMGRDWWGDMEMDELNINALWTARIRRTSLLEAEPGLFTITWPFCWYGSRVCPCCSLTPAGDCAALEAGEVNPTPEGIKSLSSGRVWLVHVTPDA